ncbi:MAG TPA: hypothetical protein VF072_03850 [Thermoleophilaceae bacterium]
MTRRRLRLRHAIALAVALVALGGTTALAAFVATLSNSGNSFQAAATFPGAIKMASGTYTGNATDNRAITVGFQPDFVIVKDTAATEGVARSSSMAGDVSKPMSSLTAFTADNIQSLTATGFTIGLDNRVNRNNRVYYWTAFKANSQAMKVGTYAGNGTTQSITGVGFQPELVILLGNNTQRAVARYSGAARTYGFDASTGVTTGVTAFGADGFSVGAAAEANTNGVAYHYVAFNDFANSINVGSYTGNNTDNRSITTPSFQPEFVMVRADDTATGRSANWHPSAFAGDNTLLFTATASGLDRIQALQATGFQLGLSTDVNANSVSYRYIAVRSSAP